MCPLPCVASRGLGRKANDGSHATREANVQRGCGLTLCGADASPCAYNYLALPARAGFSGGSLRRRGVGAALTIRYVAIQ
jgi:hypothetical protein